MTVEQRRPGRPREDKRITVVRTGFDDEQLSRLDERRRRLGLTRPAYIRMKAASDEAGE